MAFGLNTIRFYRNPKQNTGEKLQFIALDIDSGVWGYRKFVEAEGRFVATTRNDVDGQWAAATHIYVPADDQIGVLNISRPAARALSAEAEKHKSKRVVLSIGETYRDGRRWKCDCTYVRDATQDEIDAIESEELPNLLEVCGWSVQAQTAAKTAQEQGISDEDLPF